MRGHIETTIPQRQYENLKINYEYENEEEKNKCIKVAIEDCIKYHHAVVSESLKVAPRVAPAGSKLLDIDHSDQVLKVVNKVELSGVVFRQRKKGRSLIWEFWDKDQVPPRWIGGEPK